MVLRVIPVRDVLTSVVARVVRSAPLSDEKVAFAWRTVVGPSLDRGTVVRYDAGTLYVTARDPLWQAEIRRGLPAIMPKLAQLLGPDVIQHVRVDAARDDGNRSHQPRVPSKG